MSELLILMAGAGSGKTSHLVKTLSQKISSGELKPEEVLISTFTKVAAAEIRDRALSKIAEDGCSPEAVMALRSASISTIHGLGLSFIRRYWYHFGISPEPEVLDEASGDRFIRNMLRTKNISIELEKRLNELNRLFAFQAKGVKKYDPNAWRSQLAQVLSVAVQNGIKSLGLGSKSYQKSLEWLNKIYPNVQTIEGDIHEMSVCSLIPEELKQAAIRELRDLPEHPNRKTKPGVNLVNTANKIVVIEDFNPKSFKDFLNAYNENFISKDGSLLVGIELNREILPRTLEYIKKLRDITENPVFFRNCQEYTEILMRLADECLIDYVNYKKENNLIDYNDMERFFLELLQLEGIKEEIRAEIQQTISLVMVDEFQDCNEIQVSIFSELLQIVKENIWVGDSKQAIYGFRGTDASVMDEIVSKIRLRQAPFAGHHVRFGMLKSSYRSVPELVGLSNEVFSRLLREQQQEVPVERNLINGFNDNGELDQWKTGVFGDLEVATLQAEHLIGLLPVRQAVEGPAPLVRCINQGSAKISETLVSTVAHLLNPNNNFKLIEDNKLRSVGPGDIAILCRNNIQVTEYAKVLTDAGFPVAYSKSDFYDSAEFRLMQSLLLFLQNPSDNLAATEISLLTQNISFENAGAFMLQKHTNAPTPPEVNVIFETLSEIADNKRFWGIKDLAEKLVAELDLIRCVSAFPFSQQRRNNLMQFIRLASEFEMVARNESSSTLLVDFLGWLESERNNLEVAPSNGPDAIQVLSMHKSKGLEWPVVIPVGNKGMFDKLVNFDKIFDIRIEGKAAPSALPLAEGLEEMHVVMGFFPFGSVEKYAGNPENVLKKELKTRLTSKEWEEHHRLMYVVATRAKNYLVDLNTKDMARKNFFGFQSMLEAEGSLKFSDVMNDIAFPTVVIGDYQPEQIEEIQQQNLLPDFEPFHVQPRLPFFLQPSKADNTGANSAVIETVKNFETRIYIDTEEGDAWNGMEDRKDEMLGNLLHAVFYLEDIQSLSNNDFMRMAGGLFSITEDNLQTLRKRHQIFFEWCHELAGENCLIHRELPLEYQENGQIWTGTADLVLEGKNGVFLIDYKSYQGGEEEITGNGAHSARIYYAQLSAYRTMLKASMEDPSAFREMMIFYPMSGLVVKLTRN